MTNPIPEPPTSPPPIPAEPPATPRRPLSPLAAGLVGLAVGAGLVGGAWLITANSGPGKPDTFTLKGAFALKEGATDNASGCEGTGGYKDISEGTAVTVYGAAGDVIATGQLGNSESPSWRTCIFDVSVPDVPKGEKFYKVEVSHRGTVQLTAKEAEAGGFAASLG
ncbi:hypothetical protein ACFY2M_19325 [Streptomyces sp. NPDC001276]|uniref:hypothetical protein n=1 Tax=Streptomyces sp. NPDC001276 TaxID=3364555 RepID=UPI003681B05C